MVRRLPRWLLLLVLVTLAPAGGCGGEAEPPPDVIDELLREADESPRAAQVEAGPTRIRLRDVTKTAGIHAVNHSGRAGVKEFLLEAVAPGISWLDFDRDGLLDLYVPDGDVLGNYDWHPVADPDAPGGRRRLIRQRPPEQREARYRDQLWRNNGDGTFTDVAERAGIVEERWSFGSTTFDYDGDGDTDIFVANFGFDTLWRNNGDGTFTDIASEVGLQGDEATWSTCAAVGDVDSDGRVDLYVGAYADPAHELERARGVAKLGPELAVDQITGRHCVWKRLPAYCGPIGLQGQHDRLYRQREDGTFEDATDAWGLRPRIPQYTFTVLMFDFDEDGLLDIYAANDSVENYMWVQSRDAEGRVRFREKADSLGIKVGGQVAPQASMGMDVADINRDGLLDIFVTNFSHDFNNMYIAQRVSGPGGGVYFKDRGLQALGQEVYYDLSWGCGWHDFDNDGDLDLYVGTGHVYKEIDLFRATGARYEQPNALFETLDPERLAFRRLGKKAQEEAGPEGNADDLEAGDGANVLQCSRQVAFGDWNNDGRMEMVVGNVNAAPTVLLNASLPSAAANWVKLTLQQPGGDREALGALIGVRGADGILHRLANVRQASFLGCNDPRLHVGLGAAPTCDVEVIWPGPDRARTTFAGLGAGRHWLLDRATGKATALPLRAFDVP